MRGLYSMDPHEFNRAAAQADIDSPLPPVSRRCMTWRDALEYLDGKPGGVLTTIVILILFAVAMWGLWAAWQLPIVRELCYRP